MRCIAATSRSRTDVARARPLTRPLGLDEANLRLLLLGLRLGALGGAIVCMGSISWMASFGGMAIVATFAPDGPEMCSGLPVQRYDETGLAERCGPRFELLDSERHLHRTPRGVEQRFMYASFRRVSEDRAGVPA